MQLTSATDRPGLAEEQASLRRVATLVAEGASADDVFSAVTKEVAGLFDAAASSLSRYEGDSCVVVAACRSGFPVGSRWPLNVDSLAARVLASGRPAYVDDYSDIARQLPGARPVRPTDAAVGVPIVAEGSIWGLLSVGAPELSSTPSETIGRITEFTELVATAISNAEARRELQCIASEQEALRRAATLVASGAPPGDVFDAIATSAAEVFGVPFSSLIRIGPDDTATMVAGCAACSAYVGQSWTVPADDPGITRTVVNSRQPSRIEDHSRVHGPIGEAARALGVGSVLGAPVLVDGSVWGVLAVGAAQDGPPLPADAGDRLVGFTELVTTTLINAETRDSLRHLADTQASLRRIATLVAEGATAEELFSSVAGEVKKVLGAPLVTVDRYEFEGGAPVSVVLASIDDAQFPVGSCWPLDGPSARAWVFETHRPVRIEDFSGLDSTVVSAARAQGVRWVVGAPIIVDGALWGNICAGTTGDEPIPDDAESRLADFTELVSTAIANSEARENVGRLLEEQAALRRVATLVARGIEPDELFVAVSDEVARLVDAEITTIGRFDRNEPHDITVVGLNSGFRGVSIGTRSPQMDWLASSVVYRTGRTARRDVTAAQITDSNPVADSVRAMGFFSTVSAPIVVEGELWGVVTASSSHASLPPNAEKRVESFGELVATALANAESRAELGASETRARALAEEQAALRRVATLVAERPASEELFSAVAQEVAGVLDVSGVLVERFDSDGNVRTLGTAYDADLEGAEAFFGVGIVMPRDPGSLAAQVFETSRTARIDDYSQLQGTIGNAARAAGLGSGVAGPILVDGELWGEMCAFSRGGSVLPLGTENRLRDFIELVATAISNYEAHAGLQRLADEQAALRRVATLVAQGAEPRHVFSAVAEEVAGIIDIPVVGVHRYETDGTFTMLGIAGETDFTVGSRWPIEQEGIAGMILATGRPSRKDDYSTMPGSLGEAVREDLRTSTVGVPIVVDGGIWGFMVAAAKPGRPIPTDTEERLARFTELVATAVSNATTRTDLLTSRARVVSAADETRRRLERDLHDGIQQWLVALALRARKAARLSAAGEPSGQELSGLADDLVAVTDELREISRGIHPAILSDAGLDDALEALARRSAIRVDLDVSFQRRYDPTLEATVYYVVAESITNAVKHAQTSTVAVCGGLRGEAIELEIKDDGVGGADPRRGSGLIGLKDRVETLGGTISFASPAGAGTTIRVSLPASPRADSASSSG